MRSQPSALQSDYGETKALVLQLGELIQKMIIRQSPSPKKSAGTTNWPPKSPHDALLSSPSGRKKAQRLYTRSSTSPSPAKRKRPLAVEDEPRISEDDEDEETLQLKLQAIEARLKLKKLQKLKSKVGRDGDEGHNRTPSPERRQPRSLHSAGQRTTVQVPASPTRNPLAPASPKSPGRVLLGIDKGLRATDVSLKKAPSHRHAESASSRLAKAQQRDAGRGLPSNFNKRLTDARGQETERQERQERTLKARSNGFGVRLSTEKSPAPASDKFTSTATTGNVRESTSTIVRSTPSTTAASTLNLHSTRKRDTSPETKDPTLYDSYSKFQLSKRILPLKALDTALDGKTILSIPQLLKTVVAPSYEPPDIDGDFVVLGIIASKSSPYSHATTHQSTSTGEPDEKVFGGRSKFMVLHLTDLKWAVDLFLFDTGFERFWKLTVGTVVAILNPFIMPPKPHMRDTGQFSLKLTSSDDTVLEIGAAQDLGFCKSIKRDGKQCGQWIDKRHTEFCEFHVNLKVEKARAGRMEVNTMTDMYSDLPANRPKSTGQGGSLFASRNSRRGRGGSRGGFKDNGLTREGRYHDGFLNETVYIAPPGSGASTAKLFDDEDLVDRGMNKSERQRKRMAAQEKERELGKKLGAAGDGLGAAYIRIKHSDTQAQSKLPRGDGRSADEPGEPADAASLGLMGSNAARLSPVKGRKSTTSVMDGAVGWSGAFKRGVPSAKRDTPAQGEGSEVPVAKKARFIIESKGIRVPGRDSIPGDIARHDDDDDDDLDIV